MGVWATLRVFPNLRPLRGRVESYPKKWRPPPEGGECGENFVRGHPLCCVACMRGGSRPGWWPRLALAGPGCGKNYSSPPPYGVCLGNPVKNSPRVPPYAERRARGEESGRAGGPGGKSLVQGGTIIYPGVPPPDGVCPGDPVEILPPPPLCCAACMRGGGGTRPVWRPRWVLSLHCL